MFVKNKNIWYENIFLASGNVFDARRFWREEIFDGSWKYERIKLWLSLASKSSDFNLMRMTVLKYMMMMIMMVMMLMTIIMMIIS